MSRALMSAVVCEAGELVLAELPAPRPAEGQVLLDVRRCGICGSDLHARKHADAQADVLAEAGYDGLMRSDQRVVMGHEFVGEVADYGAGCRRKVATGQPVVALPLRRQDGGIHPIGLSVAAPGAYAEQVVVQETLMLPVPNGLSLDMAALTEPLAIGWHAVQRADVSKKDVSVVVGCGPVGLAIVAMLKAKGVRTVVASDPSAARRRLATACGADIVVDPAAQSPFAAAGDRKHLRTVPQGVGLVLDTMDKIRWSPVPWQHVWRAAERATGGPERPVVFECVGVPGILDSIIADAPLLSRIVVVGVCMQPDTIRPAMAINKQVELRFVVGYTPLEFRQTLHMLAEGKVHAAPMLTGTVGLAGVAGAFEALGDPEAHAKILIDPRSEAELVPHIQSVAASR